jgi:hypothetical protein
MQYVGFGVWMLDAKAGRGVISVRPGRARMELRKLFPPGIPEKQR